MTIQVISPPASTEIPNGAIINGVANFCQSTKPTIRIDGSALVARDRWYNTSDGSNWFWNGTYWLSEQKIFYSQLTSNVSTDFNFTPRYWYYPTSGGIFLNRLEFYGQVSRPFTQGWSLFFNSSVNDGGVGLPITPSIVLSGSLIDINVGTGTALASFNHSINSYFSVDVGLAWSHRVMTLAVRRSVGSGIIQPGVSIYYHLTI